MQAAMGWCYSITSTKDSPKLVIAMDLVNHWGLPLLAALTVASISLIGAFTLWIRPARLRVVVPVLVSLAVGVLLGDAFLHLIPEAVESIGSVFQVCLYVLAGMVMFFGVEKVVRWRHRHDVFDAAAADGGGDAMARMNLVGDAIHNFIDGVLIAGSFSVDPVVGVTTTLALIAHEIPQEIGDVGALIHGGYSPRRAVFLNFLCALTVIAGVLFTLLIAEAANALMPYLLPVSAGGFIYIAAADFIPSLHSHRGFRHDSLQVATVAMGVLCMLGITVFEQHSPPSVPDQRALATFARATISLNHASHRGLSPHNPVDAPPSTTISCVHSRCPPQD
ncbi:ZIP family metal transporter [Steroidobacter gossypii]|nr:ZIP family metal transporter [Steroidobacter gossypii]